MDGKVQRRDALLRRAEYHLRQLPGRAAFDLLRDIQCTLNNPVKIRESLPPTPCDEEAIWDKATKHMSYEEKAAAFIAGASVVMVQVPITDLASMRRRLFEMRSTVRAVDPSYDQPMESNDGSP